MADFRYHGEPTTSDTPLLPCGQCHCTPSIYCDDRVPGWGSIWTVKCCTTGCLNRCTRGGSELAAVSRWNAEVAR